MNDIVYKFSVMNFSNVKVSKFQTKDELLDAIVAIRHKDNGFIALKFNKDLDIWIPFDVCE